MSRPSEAEEVVQRQLDAYNARDLERWLQTYAPDAVQLEIHGGVLATGHDEMRKRMATRFAEPDLHARLLRRCVMGNLVVDHERITRNFADGKGIVEMLCVYEVRDGVIVRASFAVGPRQPVEEPRPAPARVATCSCGQLRAEVASADPVRNSICHCLACQRRTGSVFGQQARYPRESVRISGASTEFVRVGDEGSSATFHFCPRCGATVYYTTQGSDDVIAIPVGAFADPGFPAPHVSVYEERMHAWVVPPPDAEHVP